jgi:ferredoxin
VDRLEEMAREMAATALCGLGQSAANPILSTLRYFREEYREHAEEGYCRAGRCGGLYQPVINAETCTGCGACLKACPAEAIEGEKKKPHQVRPEKCLTCGACLRACRFTALTAERRPAHA